MTDFTEANRKYFDQMATTYKDSFAQSLKMLSEQTVKHRSWISDRWIDTEAGKGQEIKMLEYACGPGAISMALAPFLNNIVGIDVSDKMVEEYNNNAKVVDMASKMIGYKADLLSESAPIGFSQSEFNNFDLVTVSLALHHFEHPDIALQKLAKRLKAGGACFIIDLVPHTDNWGHNHSHGHGHDHGHSHEQVIQQTFGKAAHTVKNHGFSKEDMQKLFQDAGLTAKFDYETLSEPLVFTKEGKTFEKTVFIARAQLV